jgi:aspartyl protease family protein
MKAAFVTVIVAGLGIGLMLPGGRSPAPAPAASVSADAYRETRLEREPGGHFFVNGKVDGNPVRFVIDTGATTVALTTEDARRIGLQFSEDEFDVVGRGASGDVWGKEFTFKKVSVEGKDVTHVRGAVLKDLDVSLLGQTYLSRITAVQMNGDSMILR